jgi:hypothetical protein
MIGRVVDVELARHQWAEGRRALDRARDDRAAYKRLTRGIDVVLAELTRRVGQTFTLEELAGAYPAADRWSLEVIDDAFEAGAPADTSVMTDAAFDRYSRRASDYAP